VLAYPQPARSNSIDLINSFGVKFDFQNNVVLGGTRIGAAMFATELIAGLDSAVEAGSPEHRSRILRQVASAQAGPA